MKQDKVNVVMNKSDQYSKDLKPRKKNWESIKQTASTIAQQHLLLINNCFI